MAVSLSAHDILNIAIGIEKTGIAFYDILSRSTENAAARDVFRDLVAMEREHLQIFENMLAKAGDYQPLTAGSEEQSAYLQALVDSAVFTDDMITSEIAAQADSDIKALELAIGAEKDSLLFYCQMQEIMPRRAYQTVSKVIAEEKTHLRLLSELKKKLTVT